MTDGKMRINASLEPEILQAIDAFAKKNGISRSGAISILTTQALDQIKGLSSLQTLAEEIRRQSPNG